MQEWKLEIIKELDKQSEKLKEIRFYDVARKMGYNHIKVSDVRDIATYIFKRTSDIQGSALRKGS